MKPAWRIPILATVIAGAFWAGSLLMNDAEASDSLKPGSLDDPIVTKSYVDQRIAEELAKIKGGPASRTPAPQQSQQPIPSSGQDQNSGSKGQMEVVLLKPGQQIIAAAGAEIIVRTGITKAVSNDDNGIPDVTAGKDIAPGAPVETNHLLVIPRDGRGIQAVPDSDIEVYVMIRGIYKVYG